LIGLLQDLVLELNVVHNGRVLVVDVLLPELFYGLLSVVQVGPLDAGVLVLHQGRRPVLGSQHLEVVLVHRVLQDRIVQVGC